MCLLIYKPIILSKNRTGCVKIGKFCGRVVLLFRILLDQLFTYRESIKPPRSTVANPVAILKYSGQEGKQVSEGGLAGGCEGWFCFVFPFLK